MKPYGYVRKDGEGLFIYGEHQFQNATDAELVPVYLHPKKWVGLTIEEIDVLGEIYAEKDRKIQMWGLFAVAVEEKLKEKNG